MNNLQLLPDCIQSYVISFFDRDILCHFAQVNQLANRLTNPIIKRIAQEELVIFAKTIEEISSRKGFVGSYHRLSTAYLNMIKDLKEIQVNTRGELQLEQIKACQVFFKEFSTNSLGCSIKGLRGSRYAILASVSVPPSLKGYYSECLETFLKKTISQSEVIHLKGDEGKISQLFFSTLLKVLSSEREEEKVWRLGLSHFSLTDQDTSQICSTLKASAFILSDFSGNLFSKQGKEKLRQHFSEKRVLKI